MSSSMTLDQAGTRLAQHSGKTVRLFATQDFGRHQNPAARSVVVAEEKAASLLSRLRGELGPGLLAFIGCTRSLARNAEKGSEIVIGVGDSQFDILRIAQSDAANYDLDTEALVSKLQNYDARYGIDIFHAETDTIEFRLLSLPEDLRGFCNDLYEFCPDIVDQGCGSVDKLEEEIANEKSVFLWWD